jgi:hypothetical protein
VKGKEYAACSNLKKKKNPPAAAFKHHNFAFGLSNSEKSSREIYFGYLVYFYETVVYNKVLQYVYKLSINAGQYKKRAS